MLHLANFPGRSAQKQFAVLYMHIFKKIDEGISPNI